ncbi:MAG: hypothetical protein IJI10_11065 [Eubacterium sp.]|nr:hypothetical protein [Eubacterium sp.]
MQIDANKTGFIEFYRLFLRIIRQDMGAVCTRVVYGFLILVVLFLIFGKGKERKYFGVMPLFLMAVMLNPFSVYYLSKYLDLSSRYFRFLWLLPVGAVYGCFLVKAAGLIKNKKAATVAAYVLSAVVLLYGARTVMAVTSRLYTGVSQNPGMVKIDNVYKIEQDTLQICEIIEADKKDPGEMARTLYGYEVFMDIRTYDASICSELSLKQQNRYRNKKLRSRRLNKMYEKGKYKNMLNYLVNSQEPDHDISFDTDLIAEALASAGYQYVVIQSDKYAAQWFEACGSVLGKTEHFTVIRVDG